ncbi:MAG: amidohydrolase family protein [Rhodobacteraceae bacterium]|nr:amidohydrolase family protein [Paracoccaceae bacterium]
MIDSHHHVWRVKDLPWLQGPEQPRIFGPYAPLRRDYLIEEYLADVAGTGIEASVYVQANWDKSRHEDEVAWVQAIADSHGWPNAIVGFCDMCSDNAEEQLQRLARYPLMRGIRQQLHWHANPAYRFADREDIPADPILTKNVARLADYGWSFDLQVFASQMEHAAGLAEACPQVAMVLQHSGMLEDLSADGVRQWRSGMERLSALPNVFVKLSAYGTFIHRNDPHFIGRMIRDTVELFGAGRCMFGSNFPIEKLWTTFGEMFSAFRQQCAFLSAAERSMIFRETAERVYRPDT